MSHTQEHVLRSAQAGSNHGLKQNTLGVTSIACYIIAAASPLTGVIAIVPIMLSIGSGVGSPAAFILAASILMLFAVGYVAMSRHVSNAGALYAYVTLGMGQLAGLGTAALTIFSYTAIQVGLYGGFGFYAAELIAQTTGASVPWWLCSAVASLACLYLGVSGVHSGAKVLGCLMTFECLLLLVLGGGMIFNSPEGAEITMAPFAPSALLNPGLGVALMFACATFIGFEGSAIYSEEARDPQRTIPRATYFSVLFMAAIYSGVTWLIICTLGTDKAVDIATKESGNLVFRVSDLVLGGWATSFFNVFIVTAIFAALVTFHNNIARYLYSLGRQNLVWAPLGYTGRKAQTPYVASIVQTISAMLCVAFFAIMKLDPYNVLFASMTGMGSIGIILAQTIAAVGIFVFFRRTKCDRRLWNAFLAPLTAVVGLCVFLYYALSSVELLLGLTGIWAQLLTALVFIVFAMGWLYGFYVKKVQPAKYARIKSVLCE
ncbi:APC family permease [Pseudomonas akapageensis]|uniref:APC family permease n=1 Tax=Pseudomonas akapageensis TaxID=2609961 RepID=UPI001409450F|nr:APC family permease [Pseudomonas akapageensis]